MTPTHDKTWVLVAESSRARLFARSGNQLEEVEDFTHPAARARNRDLDSDKPGRSFGAGAVRHAMEPQHASHRSEAEAFARELVERLETGRGKGDFTHVVLIAPPEFLGLLRHAMHGELSRLVVQSVDKNLVHAQPADILDHLGLH